jgi:hypothetical protein
MLERFNPQQQAEVSKKETKILETNWHIDHTRPAVPH